MLRNAMIFALLLTACSAERDDDTETNDAVPIGPGTDTTALIPPDTQVTPPPELPGLLRPDSVRDTLTTMR
jgi:hypothetical protein